MDRYLVGTRIRVSGVFATDNLTADPDSEVSATAKRADGAVTDLPVDRLAPGHFVTEVDLDTPGRWCVRLSCATAAAESEFYVAPSGVI